MLKRSAESGSLYPCSGGDSMNDVDQIQKGHEPSGHLQSAYNPDSTEMKVHVDSTDYSNMAYILVSYRDVMVDFLQMPGQIEDDGKNHVHAHRIFMSHAAAKALAESILNTLENAHDSGQFEQYSKN